MPSITRNADKGTY